MTAPRPNFFLAGAAKCGTTAMYSYLVQHPDVFMPRGKEPLYFGKDLEIADEWRLTREEEYLGLFKDAGSAKRIGEASPWSVYSRTAPGEIKALCPDAKIIIMIRHPVDMMNSTHLQMINVDAEDILDFEEALAAEEDRKAGRRMPARAPFPRCLLYREVATFSPQIERYYETFGRENVQVHLLDDLKKDPREVYRKVLTFLDLDSSFEPEFEVKNPSRNLTRFDLFVKRVAYRNRRLLRLTKKLPPWVWKAYRSFNKALPVARAKGMRPETRERLMHEFRDEIERLGTLIDRDLSAWL